MLVSILIPCYNSEKWIAQCIESALAQTHESCEVIVYDDGSTDGSLDIIRSYAGRVRVDSGENRGGNYARNRLLKMSSGEWLQYLDSDDYLKEDKIARQLQVLDAHKDADVIFSPTLAESLIGRSREGALRLFTIKEPDDPWILLLCWKLPQTNASLWRREAVVRVGGWKEDQPCAQEHELYSRLLVAGAVFRYCEYAGSVYREWSEGTVSRRDVMRVYRERLKIIERTAEHLKEQGGLSIARLEAFNQARFDIARQWYLRSPEEADKIMERVVESQPDFVPLAANVPSAYVKLYSVLGFLWTERIAAWLRRLRR